MADQPVQDQPGAQQHRGRARQPGQIARQRPDPQIGAQPHQQRGADGDDHAEAVQAVLELQIADQRGDQRTAEVAGVIDRR